MLYKNKTSKKTKGAFYRDRLVNGRQMGVGAYWREMDTGVETLYT